MIIFTNTRSAHAYVLAPGNTVISDPIMYPADPPNQFALAIKCPQPSGGILLAVGPAAQIEWLADAITTNIKNFHGTGDLVLDIKDLLQFYTNVYSKDTP